jgi:hypothetical protein
MDVSATDRGAGHDFFRKAIRNAVRADHGQEAEAARELIIGFCGLLRIPVPPDQDCMAMVCDWARAGWGDAQQVASELIDEF